MVRKFLTFLAILRDELCRRSQRGCAALYSQRCLALVDYEQQQLVDELANQR